MQDMLYPEIHLSSMLAMIADEADDLRGLSGRGLSAGNIGSYAKARTVEFESCRRSSSLSTSPTSESTKDMVA
jgi:hypothetical protein